MQFASLIICCLSYPSQYMCIQGFVHFKHWFNQCIILSFVPQNVN